MGKDNGIIRDGVKGGNQARVQNGALHVRLLNGVPGGLVVFPIPQADGGTGRSSAMTAGSVVFAGASTYEQDNVNFFWDNTNKFLGIGTNAPIAPLSFGATFGLPSGTAGRKINLFSGNAHYSIGLDGGTVWFTSQIFFDFYRKDVATDLHRVRFDLGNDRYKFGTDPTLDTGFTFQITGPSDAQLSLNAPTGQRFTTLALMNNQVLRSFFSNDVTDDYTMLGHESTRIMTFNETGVIIGVNQVAPDPNEFAVLQLIGDGMQCFTVPRLTTTQRGILEGQLGSVSNVGGGIIYDTDVRHFYGYDGVAFLQLDN